MPKHPVFCSILKRLQDGHRYSDEPFRALAEFKTICEQAKQQTFREIERKTPDCASAKLVIASTALRAYKHRHLKALMRCCEAWEPVGKCFEPISLECTDFQKLCHTSANLTLENLTEREEEIANLPWTQAEKDKALARCRSGQRAWRAKKPMLCLHAVTDEDAHCLEDEDESGWRLCEYWGTIFQARGEGPRHGQHKEVLRYVQKALADFSWTIDRAEFDELVALKKDSAPGPDGIPYGVFWCAGGLGAHFLFNTYKYLVEGGAVPEQFAISRTVFIPKFSDIDDNGRIIRSPEALRPFTLCNCDCKLLTSAICRGLHWYTVRCIHPSQRCVASRQMTDNMFEIETAALAHVACAPQEPRISLLLIPMSKTPGSSP